MVKNAIAYAGDARDTGSIPRLGRFPGVGNVNLLWYSCLENSKDRRARWATVYGATKSQIWLSTHTHTHTHTHTDPLRVMPVVPQPLQPAPQRTPWLWCEIIVLIPPVVLHLPCSLGPCGWGVKIVSHEKKGQGRAFSMLLALALEHSVIVGSKYTNTPRLSWTLVIYFKYDYLYNI